MERLLQEFKEFSKKHHAKIVHARCLKAGKINLARSIAIKYGLPIASPPDDQAVAFAYALLATQPKKP